ncbi:hypothetical protein R6Q57_001901 [Mikania cordata]
MRSRKFAQIGRLRRRHGVEGGDRPSSLWIPIRFLRVVSLGYFDLNSLRNTNQQEGIRFRIHAECQRAYKDLKLEFRNNFASVGGYKDVEKARTKPPI